MLALDGFEQRLEVALTERLRALAVNDLIEQRRAVRHRLGEDLQQIALVVAVHQDAEVGQHFDVFVNLAHAIRQHVVVRSRHAEERDAPRLQAADGVHDVLGLHGDVLHARAPEELKVLVNLRLLLTGGGFVDGKLHASVAARHHLGHERGVFGGDVLVIKGEHVLKAQNILVPLHPHVHLAEFDIPDGVVHGLDANGVARLVLGAEARQERTVVLIALHQAVHRVAVGADGRDADAAEIIFQRHRLVPHRRSAIDGRLEGEVAVFHRKGDVLHKVAVVGDLLGHRVAGAHGGTEPQADIFLLHGVAHFVLVARFEAGVARDGEPEGVLVEEGRRAGIVDKMPNVVNSNDRKEVLAHRCFLCLPVARPNFPVREYGRSGNEELAKL